MNPTQKIAQSHPQTTQRPPHPDHLPFTVAGIPPQIACLTQWVNWRWKWIAGTGDQPGRWTKVPLDPKTGKNASTTVPATWSTLQAAAAYAERHLSATGGIGFVFTEASGYVGIDFDHCRDVETGTIDPDVLAQVTALGSYTEPSVSGSGLHVIVKATHPGGRKRKGPFECYATGRYFTVTGQPLDGYETIQPRQDALNALHGSIFTETPKPPAAQPPAPPTSCEMAEILARVVATHKGRALHTDGSITGYDSQSEAELALCNLYAMAGADLDQADDLIRHSALFRAEKWDSRRGKITYGDLTLNRAFDGSVRRFDAPQPIYPTPTINGGTYPAIAASNPMPQDAALLADDTPCDLRLAAAMREIETLHAQNMELRAELAAVRAENTAIVGVVTNPDLKAEAPTILRTVFQVAEAQRQGKVDDNGFVRVSSQRIGDDYDDRDKPIRNRATVKRHLERVAEVGLLERKVRPDMVSIVVRDKTGQPIRDPLTGKPRTVDVQTPTTWIKFTGEDVADMLTPFATFRAPDVIKTPNGKAHPYVHGGDRRSADFTANRAICPDCGSLERQTFCRGCGSDISAIVDTEAPPFHDETGVTLPTTPPFQDCAQENVVLSTCGDVVPLFHLETGVPQPSPQRRAGWSASGHSWFCQCGGNYATLYQTCPACGMAQPPRPAPGIAPMSRPISPAYAGAAD